MTSQSMRITRDEIVVDALVVGEVETQREQALLQIPVSFGQQHEIGVSLLHGLDRVPPEFAPRFFMTTREVLPCLLEHVAEQQHGHVTPNPVALIAYLYQFFDHRLARPGVSAIQLRRVDPRREIWVLAVSDPSRAGSKSLTPAP